VAATALPTNGNAKAFALGAYSDNPVFIKQRERLIEAMRKAGVPEG
jgi:hypothetical protein